MDPARKQTPTKSRKMAAWIASIDMAWISSSLQEWQRKGTEES